MSEAGAAESSHRGLGIGERAPDFVAPTGDGTETRFYSRAGGRPALLMFSTDGAADTLALLERFGTRASRHLVVPETGGPEPTGQTLESDAEESGAKDLVSDAPGGIDCFYDDGVIRAAYRIPPEGSFVVLLDRNLRVLTSVDLGGGAAATRLEDALVATDPAVETATVTGQAPVLFVPRVLEPPIRHHLQQIWSASHEETGVEHSVQARRRSEVHVESKRRQDHTVADADLIRLLTQSIGRRVLPEIRRYFGFAADRFEGFKISCYDASSGGFFDAHRDNLSPSTAHRRFAMSLNLNDDYDGGELRFPEFSDALHRPAAGEALIFACSMLHEVAPVTRGMRFTLLSFLFDADAARQRRMSDGPAQG